MESWAAWAQLGLSGAMLAALFLGLRSGAIHTDRSVQEIKEQMNLRLDDIKDQVKREQAVSDKVDARNDLLAHSVGEVIEMAKANGMWQMLPKPPPSEGK